MIESDVWIGDGTIIMPGVRLATGCVIGANSVVTRDTLPYGIYAGAPASLRRRRFRDETCAALVESAWWDVPYPALKAMPLDRIEEFLAKLAQIDPPQVAVMATYAVSA